MNATMTLQLFGLSTIRLLLLSGCYLFWASYCLRDFTIVPGARGCHVASLAIQRIEESGAFPEHNVFLNRLAMLFNYGDPDNKFRGNGRGIFAVTNLMWVNAGNALLFTSSYHNIKHNYCISDFLTRHYDEAMEVPIYGALAVILLLTRRGSVPPRYDIETQAKFVCRIYGHKQNSEFFKAFKDISFKFDNAANGIGPLCMQSKLVGTDLLIALDLSTGELSQDEWKVQNLLQLLIRGLDIGPGLDQIRPTIMVFLEHQYSVDWQTILHWGFVARSYEYAFVQFSNICYSNMIGMTQSTDRRLTNQVFTEAGKMFSETNPFESVPTELDFGNSRLYNDLVAKTLVLVLNGPSDNISLTMEKRKEFQV